MIDWESILSVLVGDLVAEWPAEAVGTRIVRHQCALRGCGERPDADCILTPGGPLHLTHTLPDLLPLAVEEECLSPRVVSVRVRGLEVATLTYHPAGVIVTTLDGQATASEGNRMAVLLDLWGLTEAVTS